MSMKPSDQVKQIIQDSPLTAYRISKLAGLRNSVLSLFLSGDRTITLDTLDALAPILGLSVESNGQDKKLAADAPKPGRPRINKSKGARKNHPQVKG